VAATILVLDDDSINLRPIAAILQQHGHNDLEAATARQAIRISKHYLGPIHLLVADVALPEKSGTQVAREILESCPELPVLFISGTPLECWTKTDQVNFSRSPPGSVDFLEKSFQASDLEMRVRKLLERRRHSFVAGESPA
jgi:two-component system, cell cycle sensor histidine kinase and response regulator CckA